MEKQQKLTIWLELLWWLITAVIVYAVLRPIHKAMFEWHFEMLNIAFVVVVITLARYIFLLPHTFLARRQILKIALMLAMVPLTFSLINGLHIFMTYIEDNTWTPLTGHLPHDQKLATEAYIWGEMLFFGVGSIISAPVFAARMMMSVWRLRNRGTV